MRTAFVPAQVIQAASADDDAPPPAEQRTPAQGHPAVPSRAQLGYKPFVLRVPAFAASAAQEDLPTTVTSLPADDQYTSGWYGIRCHDSWKDPVALLNGEKGWVLLALRRCERAYIVQCVNRDPLLLLRNMCATRQNTDLSSVLTFLALDPSTTNSVHLEDIACATQAFFTCQQITAPHHDMSAEDRAAYTKFQSKVVPNPHKTYSTVALGVDDLDNKGVPIIRFPGILLCPRKPLIDSSVSPHHIFSVVAAKDSTTSDIASAASSNYPFLHMQSKSTLRVVTVSKVAQSDIDFFLALPGVLKVVVLGKPHWKLSLQNKTRPLDQDRDGRRHRAHPTQQSDLIIRRFDGNPVSITAARSIASHFGLEEPRPDPNNLTQYLAEGRSVEKAKSVHGAIICDVYVVVWPGADV